jgi:hypothetical protein
MPITKVSPLLIDGPTEIEDLIPDQVPSMITIFL